MFKKSLLGIPLFVLIFCFAGCSGTPGTFERSESKSALCNQIQEQQTSSKVTEKSKGGSNGTSSHSNRKIHSLLFQNLMTTSHSNAGQKSIENPEMINKIIDCIDKAPKTITTYESTPGTMLILSCSDCDFTISLQHGDILSYKNQFYQVDSKLRNELIVLYDQASEQEKTVEIK